MKKCGDKISEMERSIIWQIMMKYHNCFVERAMQKGTGRRRAYDLATTKGRVLINGGWLELWQK